MKLMKYLIVVIVCIGFAMTSISQASELHQAAIQGDLDKVKLMLKKGKKVSEKDHQGRMPLHYAVASAKIEIVKYLIKNRANPDAKDSIGKTPLHYACAADMSIPFSGKQFGSIGFGMMLVDKTFTDIVEFLLTKQANLNIADINGVTPLHEIAESSSKSVHANNRAKALLSAGADRTLKDKKGRTPFESALEKNNKTVADILASNSSKDTGPDTQLEKKKTDPSILIDVIKDYLTLIVWIINRDKFSNADVWKSGRSLLDKHHFEGAKARGTIAVPESFKAVLVTGGLIALKFGDSWVDPLPILIDSRGDFPPIRVRKGSVSPLDDKVRLRIDIEDGTEVMVDEAIYIYRSGQWK